MRRDKWVLISSVLMLGLCALPYGCGGKAVDGQGQEPGGDGGYVPGGDGYHPEGTFFSADGRGYHPEGTVYGGDGSYVPVGRPIDGRPYSVDGCFGSRCGDGGYVPPIADGEPYYDGWDETHGDGVGPDGDSTPNNADGAAPEGAADGWAQ